MLLDLAEETATLMTLAAIVYALMPALGFSG